MEESRMLKVKYLECEICKIKYLKRSAIQCEKHIYEKVRKQTSQ